VYPEAHRLADEYVELASNLVLYPSVPSGIAGLSLDGPSGIFPFGTVSALQYLKSPMRRPTVIERWCPYEIAVFEASIAEHGKEFHLVQRDVQTKSTREIIDFYYIWKKTSHYMRWKDQYVPPYLDVSDDDEDNNDNRNKNSSSIKLEPGNSGTAGGGRR